jgi:hypothetical protein
MSRVLEDEAVTAVPPSVVEGMVAALEAHAHDPGVVGILVSALAKLAANPENHEAIEASGALDKIVSNIREHGHTADPRVCEGLAALVLPLSFDPFFVRNVIGPSNVAPLLIEIADKYAAHLTTFVGSPMSWVPENAPDHNKSISAITAADTPDADEKNRRLPRVAQCCAQSLANLACDNDVNPTTGKSTVDLLIEHGAVDVLGALMRRHRDNPRLLEDSICGLSNLAFVSDAIQLSIGRSCMASVCAALLQYNGDAYLFQMTLRAIGNLTRTDENIVRAVGYGAFRGMVEGMGKHKDNADVLKLCADVMGNMASIDDKKLPREDGIAILKECMNEVTAALASGGAGAGGGGGRTPGTTPAPPPPSSPRAPGPPPPSGIGSPAPPPPGSLDVLALVESAENIKYAVCSLLYGDGGARVLVEAMLAHPSRPELAASCLRALHYISSSADLTAKMVEGLSLAEHVVYIMQANDTSADVLRRGARILGGIAGLERLAPRLVAARAPPMLLTAIESQRANRDVCFLCYSVLTLLRGPAVTTAVREVRAVDTTVALFRRALGDDDVEFYAVLLELMLSLATDPAMARLLAARGAPALISLLGALARSGAPTSGNLESITLFSYVLSTVSAVCKAGEDAADPFLQAGLVGALLATLDCVLGRRDPRILLNRDARRAVLSSISIFGDLVRPPLLPGEEAPLIPYSMDAAERVIAQGGAAALEQVVTVYRAIPDVANPNALLFDANTCKAAVAVLTDLEACGHTPAISLTLDAELQGSAAGARGAKAGPGAQAQAAAAPPPAAPAAAPHPPTIHAAAGPHEHVGPAVAGRAEGSVTSMINVGVPATLWTTDGKARPAQLKVSVDRAWVVAALADTKGGETVEVPIAAVAAVRMGLPAHTKKKMFGKAAKAEKSFFVEDAAGTCLLHVEIEGEGERGTASAGIAALAGVKRS